MSGGISNVPNTNMRAILHESSLTLSILSLSSKGEEGHRDNLIGRLPNSRAKPVVMKKFFQFQTKPPASGQNSQPRVAWTTAKRYEALAARICSHIRPDSRFKIPAVEIVELLEILTTSATYSVHHNVDMRRWIEGFDKRATIPPNRRQCDEKTWELLEQYALKCEKIAATVPRPTQ
ncbi:hypothetical protein Y032_0086g1912 [Ancylostoma ceylanicum]|nr:hypothetical protein Y032_0086g1912 [Ancylostoma ceylanicum]